MFLEQITIEVSNRSSFEDEIKEAIFFQTKVLIIKGELVDEQKLEENPNKKEKLTDKVSKKKLKKKESRDDFTKKSNSKKDITDDIEGLRELYGLLEDQNTAQVDYGKLFSYLGRKAQGFNIYEELEEMSENSSGMISEEEAKHTVQKIQMSYLTGNSEGISWNEKEKFQYWQEFNKSLLMLYHQVSGFRTDNVNYNLTNT